MFRCLFVLHGQQVFFSDGVLTPSPPFAGYTATYVKDYHIGGEMDRVIEDGEPANNPDGSPKYYMTEDENGNLVPRRKHDGRPFVKVNLASLGDGSHCESRYEHLVGGGAGPERARARARKAGRAWCPLWRHPNQGTPLLPVMSRCVLTSLD